MGSPALQGWSVSLDLWQNSQAMLLSAHPTSQPDTQKFKGILWHCCEVKDGEALHMCVDRELFEPNWHLVSVFLYTFSKLWDWR